MAKSHDRVTATSPQPEEEFLLSSAWTLSGSLRLVTTTPVEIHNRVFIKVTWSHHNDVGNSSWRTHHYILSKRCTLFLRLATGVHLDKCDWYPGLVNVSALWMKIPIFTKITWPHGYDATSHLKKVLPGTPLKGILIVNVWWL